MGKCLFNDWRLGRSLGHSYSRRGSGVLSPDTEYEFISTEKHLLPEEYSWWGIDNEENSKESIYGTCKFSFSFPYMLQQFCHAHVTKNNPEPTLFFKKAGTLRYRKEICYVILICANTDLPTVEHLPPLTGKKRHVTLNEMLDETGMWNGVDCNFFYNKKSYEAPASWEHLVFAFYFGPNSNANHLVLERKSYDTIPHPVKKCISKNQIRRYQWVCPDEVPNELKNQPLENEHEDDHD